MSVFRLSAEEDFISKNEGFIKHTVWNFANQGGYYDVNKDIIEDMEQEARLAVIKRFKRVGKTSLDDVVPYGGTVKNACYQAIFDNRPIRVPVTWLKQGDNRQDEYETLSIEVISDDSDSSHPFVDFPDEVVLSRVMIDSLIRRIPEKEAFVMRLLSLGLTPYQIHQQYGIHHYTVRRYIAKARRILEEGDCLRKGHGKVVKRNARQRSGRAGAKRQVQGRVPT